MHGHSKNQDEQPAEAGNEMQPAKKRSGHGHGMSHGHGHGRKQASSAGASGASPSGEKGYVLIAVVYLLGLFIGALDMGIITPARTLMQSDLGVDDAAGVWILTIYTLAYASSIPIMGKLADKYGRKYIYLTCILFFGVGSLLCGLSQNVGSFEMLIAARCIQAIGGGGIMPIATAEVGTSFPEEKRGMALGLVGAVYGVSSVFGASAGSLILDIVGQHNWQFIFYVNVPICVVVSALGIMKLPNRKEKDVKPIDILGILVMTVMILSLMYFLKIVDFFEFKESITDPGVYPYLIAFVVLIPVFILVERRAKDPVMNLSYFTNRDIIVTLLCSIVSGIILMGVIFLPQFCENALYMPSGDGGYFIIVLGIFCGVGSPMTGMLIDRFGVKPPLAFGFLAALAGCIFTAFVACAHPNIPTVVGCLCLMGLGMGFTMGTPLNYMMLAKTDEAESNSALAMLSLVRSMGTAVAPAIMVAFIVHAGAGMQDSLMEVMPKQVTVSPLPYAQELDDEMEEMRSDDNFKKMLKGLDIPKLADYQTIDVDMDAEDSDFDVEVSDEIVDELSASDVTTIVEACKHMASDIFGQVSPQLTEDAQEGLETAIAKMEKKTKKMTDAIDEMADGLEEMDDGLAELGSSISEMDSKIGSASSSISTMDKKIKEMDSSIAEMDEGIASMNEAVKGMEASIEEMESTMGPEAPPVAELKAQLETMKGKLSELETARKELSTAREKVKAARDGIAQGKQGMQQGRSEMVSAKAEMQSGRAELAQSKADLSEAYDSLKETISKLKAVDDAIPGLFEEAEANYLAAIDENSSEIQKVYQACLNEGFKGMFLFVGACCLFALVVLVFFRDDNNPARREIEGGEQDEQKAIEG